MLRLARSARWSVAFLIFIGLGIALPATPQPAPSENDAIIHHLNAAITWYRHVIALSTTAGEPGDVLYLDNARKLAVQTLQYAFQAATAQAALLAASKPASAEAAPTQQQNLASAAVYLQKQISQTQSQLHDVEKQLETARASRRQPLIAQHDALQGQLDMYKLAQGAVQQIAGVGNVNENSGGALAAQINQLKQSVPEVFGTGLNRKDTSAPAPSATTVISPTSGLISRTSLIFEQLQDIHRIDQAMAETLRLRETAQSLQKPLRTSLRNLFHQAQQLAAQPANAPPAQTNTQQAFAALTAQFKQHSDAAVPLGEEIIVLNQCHSELGEWRNSLAIEYAAALRALLLRAGAVLIALVFVFFLSRVWRRATVRYVRDTRRRRQLALIRRFVIGFLVVIVIVVGFISEFSSLATFAGLITAGVAVALQTVILSIAAYFFVVGRYGVSVGDRVTVSGVTGDVIEIGLVRLYLMELSGTGIDLYPTGRVVVFSNSVMFQHAPFFKQLPGTAYAWHELVIALAPNADYASLEQKVLAAINEVYVEYQHTIEHQHARVERLLDTSIDAPVPRAQLLFADTGLELAVRYPVEIVRAADIDEKITRKLMAVIGNDAELSSAVTGSPRLRAAIRA